MNVALINPPFLPDYSRGQRSPAVTRSGTLYYPLWLSYAAAHARRLGHEILLFDAPAERADMAEVVRRVGLFAPQVIVVETATPSIEEDLQAACVLKNAFPGVAVYACGTHVSAQPEECARLAPELNGFFVGEFEIPLEEALRAVAEGVSPAGREGIFIPGNAVQARTRYFEDLDARPFAAEIYREFLPIERYFNPNAHHPMAAIITGRGCPHACSFCVFPQTLTGRGYRKRSVDSIIAEIRWIAANLPEVKGVFFEDDTFTADRGRVQEFCRRFATLELPLTWTANSRADLDRETMVLMKKARLRALCVGFESGSQELLDAIGKGLRLEQAVRFARDACEVGIKIHGCFMVGLPGETRVTLQQTLQFALQLPLDTAQFYPLMVYPGTRAYEWARQAGMLTANRYRDWLSPEGLHQCVVRTPDLSSRQLVKFCHHARRKFYLRKSYLLGLLVRIVHDQDERNRVLRSARTFLRHLWLD
jgi:radical SAM superfamily enzyme YgiQ (UPF0313 family)